MNVKQPWRTADHLFKIGGALFLLSGFITLCRHKLPIAFIYLAVGGFYFWIARKSHRT